MKTTKYFVSSQRNFTQVKECVDDVTTLRDNFIEENIDKIGKVDFEDVKINAGHNNNQVTFAVLTFTYYPK